MSEWLGIGFTQLDSTKSVKKVCITLKGSCFPGTFVIAFNEMWFRSGPTKDWLKLELYPDSFSCDSSVQPSWTRDNSTCFQVRSISSEYTFSISKSILILYYNCCILFIEFAEPPSPGASRSLVMIAKCLQNLANLVEFGSKESYMEVVNPFILKNKERMVVFLDHLSVSL